MEKQKRKKKTSSKYTKWIYVIPVILWMIFIFYMSSQNGDESSSTSGVITDFIVGLLEKIRKDGAAEEESLRSIVGFGVRKLAHMFEYGVLFFLTLLAANKTGEGKNKSTVYNKILAVLISFFYACTDELHQLMVSGRAGRMTDVLIDMIGVLIVLIFISAFKSSKWRIVTCFIFAVLIVGIFVWLLIGNFA